MMPRLRAPAIVEGAFLAAVAVLLFLAREYVPVLGVVGDLFCPAPFVYLAARHGLRPALLAVGVTTVVLAWASPFMAVMFLLTFGLLGVALGEGIRRRLPWGMVAIIGTYVTVLTLAPTFALIRAWMEIDPMALTLAGFARMAEQMQGLFREYAGGNALLLQQADLMVRMVPFVTAATPALMVLGAMGLTLVNIFAAAWLLGRLGMRLPTHFRCYDACFGGAAAGAALLLADRATEPVVWVMGWNIAVFFALLYAVQGLAVAAFFFDDWTRAWQLRARQAGTLPLVRLARLVTLLFVLAQGWQLLILAGLLDNWLDFRKLQTVPAGGGKLQ